MRDKNDPGAIGAVDGTDGGLAAHIRALATDDASPDRAIEACLAHIEEAAPALRAAVEAVLASPAPSDDELTLFIRSLFILAGGRDTASCGLFYRLARQPSHRLDDLLGDIVTEDLPRLLASVFDGDAAALFGLIEDRRVDEYARGAAHGAATFLAGRGRIDRAEMRAFLQRFWETRAGEPSDYIWMRWVESVGLLGLHDLTPVVERAFADGVIDPTLTDRPLFERDLAAADRDDPTRFSDGFLGYLDDAVEGLAWCRHASRWGEADPSSATITNPYRNVGRNDPCPCGSGRKFKKCCLTAA